MSHFMIGDTAKYGLRRPKLGPLQLKNNTGKTPVLDVGTLSQIKSGKIKVNIIAVYYLFLLPPSSQVNAFGLVLIENRPHKFMNVSMINIYML